MIVVATASDLVDDDFRMLETVLGKESLIVTTINQDYTNASLKLLVNNAPKPKSPPMARTSLI